MPDDDRHCRRLALSLLRRVVAAGKASRFRLIEVCPTDAATHLAAFESLVEWGYVERVTVRVGEWYYRLTDAAHATLAGEPLLFGVGYFTPDREYQGAALGRWE